MIKADLEDLRLERWLRARNAGEITWTTKDGKVVPIKDMTDSHLDNTINYLILKEEHDAIVMDSLGGDWNG